MMVREPTLPDTKACLVLGKPFGLLGTLVKGKGNHRFFKFGLIMFRLGAT